MDQAPRYAIYFVPAAHTQFYRYGSSILGYDSYTGKAVDFPREFGDETINWNELTAPPRRYGFHATLKAPFYLSPACTETQLVNALQSCTGLGPCGSYIRADGAAPQRFLRCRAAETGRRARRACGVMHDDL